MKQTKYLKVTTCKAEVIVPTDEKDGVGGEHGYCLFWRFVSFETMK